MTHTTNIKTLALLAGLALGPLQLAACGDDGETAPPDNSNDGGDRDGGPRAGRSGSGGSGGGTSDGGVPDSGPQAGSRADAGAPDGGIPDSGSDASTPACPEDPQTNQEFLNRCTDSQCEPFDNQERIEHPDYVEGEPLPVDYP